MVSASVEINLPALFRGMFPLGEKGKEVAIEHAPLQARVPQAVLADFFSDISSGGVGRTYFIVANQTKLLEENLARWVEAVELPARRSGGGIRFPDLNSAIYLSKPDEIVGSDLPFWKMDRLAIFNAESITNTFFTGLSRRVKRQTIVAGEFCSRDHWFYQWARSGPNLFRLPASRIVESYPDEATRLVDLRGIYSDDQVKRFLELEDIEVTQQKIPDYLKWVGDKMANATNLPFSKMHLDMNLWFKEFISTRRRKDCVLGPRVSAKSTHGAEGLPLFAICHGLERYILIISDSTDQAKKHLSVIKEELEANEIIAKEYPEVAGQGPVWRDDAIETRNGIRVEALGAGKKIRGRRYKNFRPSLIIVDDPESDEAAYSKKSREHRKDWFFKGVMKAGGPESNFLVIGSNLHNDCVVATVAHSPGWKKHIYQAIQKWPDRMDLWAKWENILRDISQDDPDALALQFYRDHKQEMDAGVDLLWEEQENLYDLMLMRATDGHAAFESEKQNNPIDPSKCEWGPHLFTNCWYDELPEEGIIASAGALDPSKGKQDKHGDYQGMVNIAFHKKKILYIDADINRRPMTEMVHRFVSFLHENDSQVGVCEEDQFQELLLPEIEGSVVEQLVSVPIEGIKTGGVNKIMRIRRCGPWINRGRVLFKRGSPGAQLLIKQLQEFPNGDNDDGPDAMEMSLRRVLQIVFGDDSESIENPF